QHRQQSVLRGLIATMLLLRAHARVAVYRVTRCPVGRVDAYRSALLNGQRTEADIYLFGDVAADLRVLVVGVVVHVARIRVLEPGRYAAVPELRAVCSRPVVPRQQQVLELCAFVL